ncbi:hypothetical protein SAMN05428953_12653 [Mesorhizobium muleiense]|uniref:Uncharacterized protein n=1 Tax=Mesorhizobium muleiense TaxID=1004279 RepID=A0A1G9H397_9HYPH|nr:hypothetical protein [Mesorhizobium muleiense]SDL07315.1 hypothetical protein SAMN05428953_12653 [Mesorhizobium muleiense]
MKLTSLKRKYSELSKPIGAETDEYYPSLYLDEKQMEGLDVDSARVGTEMTMTATVRVSSLSESKNGSRSMSFEIVEAGFEPKEKKPDAASVLFPNG